MRAIRPPEGSGVVTLARVAIRVRETGHGARVPYGVVRTEEGL
jgi:hypothetical protein